MYKIKSFLKNIIKPIYRFIIYREKRSSESYIAHLRKIGMRIGDRVRIMNPSKVHIDDTRPYLIEMGNDIVITDGVTILTHGYDWFVIDNVYHKSLGSAGKVTIGNNVFIGMKSTILKGVTISSNVIIGANSCITHDIPDNCVVAGNPAKVVSSLEDYYKKRVNVQKKEALEIAFEWIKVNGKRQAPIGIFHEFYWLFATEEEVKSNQLLSIMLFNSGDTIREENFRKCKKEFKNYPDFWNYCVRMFDSHN